MLCSKERSSKRRIYKNFTSSCASLLWLLRPFNCREQSIINDSSLTDLWALFPDRRFEIPLHRETDPDIVMGARRARI